MEDNASKAFQSFCIYRVCVVVVFFLPFFAFRQPHQSECKLSSIYTECTTNPGDPFRKLCDISWHPHEAVGWAKTSLGGAPPEGAEGAGARDDFVRPAAVHGGDVVAAVVVVWSKDCWRPRRPRWPRRWRPH